MITEHGSTEANLSGGETPEYKNTSQSAWNEAIEKLAQMDSLSYEQSREEEAKKFKIKLPVLDKAVKAKQKSMAASKAASGLFPEITPYESEVVLSDLLDELVRTLNKYVSFQSDHEPKAIALWVVHTYCIEAAYITPILFVTSAEMRSGKSTLLAILQNICFRCIAASSVTPSVLFRVITKYHPTLICDEADTYLTDKNEDLRCIFNAGHSRTTAGVLRTNPDTLEPEVFDAFGAKCIAAIKGAPGTVEDRSVIIKMRRVKKGQKKEKLRLIEDSIRKEFLDIQRKCLRFFNDSMAQLKIKKPKLPDQLHDRAADNWYVLFQIAQLAGDDWLKQAEETAIYLSGVEQEYKSHGVELLEDIKNIFDGKLKEGHDVKTADLIEALCEDQESPWATYNRGMVPHISARQLARILKPYGVYSRNLPRGSERPKGYLKEDFKDAFTRYIVDEPPNFSAPDAPTAPAAEDGALNEVACTAVAATIRSDSHKEDTCSELAADSGVEREVMPSQNPIKPAPNVAGAAVADSSVDLERSSQDYIDL